MGQFSPFFGVLNPSHRRQQWPWFFIALGSGSPHENKYLKKSYLAMKKNTIFFDKSLHIKGAKAGTIDLGKLWSAMYLSLSSEDNLRKRPGTNNGLLQFLVDTQDDNAMFELQPIKNFIETPDGKKYTAVYGFMPRQARQTANGSFVPCGDDGETIRMKYETKNIGNRFYSRKYKIPNGYVRCIKEGKAEYQDMVIAEALRTYLDAFGREISDYVVSKGYVGTFAKGGGTSCKSLPLFAANGREINAQGEIQLNEDMLQAEAGQRAPVIVGGTRLTAYAQAKQIATVNTTLGVDLAQLGMETMFYRDTNVGSVPKGAEGTDPNRVLAIIPGALKLLTTTQNQGDFADEFDDQLRGTTIDPYYQLEHDYYIFVDKCKNQIEYSIQFAIDWDILGYPDCWAEDDDEFNGVTDVFCYSIDCSDDGVCGMDSATGHRGGLSDEIQPCGPGYDECTKTCEALFKSVCEELAVFSVAAQSAGNISGIKIDSVEYSAGGVFDISTQAGADGLVAALQNVLNPVGNIKVFSGGWESVGSDAEFALVGETTILDVELINDAAANIKLVRDVNYYTNVKAKDASTVSTGADYATSTLSWTAPGPVAFSGNPADSIFSSVTANHYGVIDNFFVLFSAAGTYQLDLVDSEGCSSTFTAETDVCDGLAFDVVVNVFDDQDGDDTDTGGPEGALSSVTMLVYEGITQDNLLDSQVTDGGGNVTFSLEAGTYNVDVDLDSIGLFNGPLVTTTPKYITVGVDGSITWGVQWTEDGKFPLKDQ